MTTPGQRAVRDALRDKQDDIEAAFFAQAVVTAVAATAVTVLFAGGTTPQTWPRLNPMIGLDVGDVVLMGGQPGAWACLGTITGKRDLAARNLAATGTLDVAGTGHVAGNFTGDGYIAKTNGFVMGQSPQGYPNLYSPTAGGVDVSLVGYNGALYSANPANSASRNMIAANIASERRLKVEHGRAEGLPVIDRLVPGRWSWADPEEMGDDTVHVGIYVDELDEVDPDAVRDTPFGHRTYEDRAVIAHLVAAVQTVAEQNRELRARLDALEGQGTGSSTSDEAPEYPDHTGNPPGP